MRIPDRGSAPRVRYMERTRADYRALGYTKDYVWPWLTWINPSQTKDR